MKVSVKLTAALLFLGIGLASGAEEAQVKREALPQNIAEKTVSELTVGDLTRLAELQSIERQKRHYVASASASSFLLPGLGQLKVGDTKGGALRLAGQIALVAGTVYGSYLLLPSDLRETGLSRSERHDLMDSYRENGNEDELYASAAVMTGGLVLSVIHSVWASSDAKSQAIDNINIGKVTFEPTLFVGRHGMGPSIRIAY